MRSQTVESSTHMSDSLREAPYQERPNHPMSVVVPSYAPPLVKSFFGGMQPFVNIGDAAVIALLAREDVDVLDMLQVELRSKEIKGEKSPDERSAYAMRFVSRTPRAVSTIYAEDKATVEWLAEEQRKKNEAVAK